MKNSRKQALPILATLNAINKKYGKLYCYPSQLRIMEKLSIYQGINISIATLNRWLWDLKDKGYITRTARTHRDKKLGMVFQSTLYTITLLGYHALKKAGVSVYKDMKAITAAGLKAGHRYLAKLKGPRHIKEVLAAPMIFGVRDKTWLVEKE